MTRRLELVDTLGSMADDIDVYSGSVRGYWFVAYVDNTRSVFTLHADSNVYGHYWGSIGDRTLGEFLFSERTSFDYVAGKLVPYNRQYVIDEKRTASQLRRALAQHVRSMVAVDPYDVREAVLAIEEIDGTNFDVWQMSMPELLSAVFNYEEVVDKPSREFLLVRDTLLPAIAAKYHAAHAGDGLRGSLNAPLSASSETP